MKIHPPTIQPTAENKPHLQENVSIPNSSEKKKNQKTIHIRQTNNSATGYKSPNEGNHINAQMQNGRTCLLLHCTNKGRDSAARRPAHLLFHAPSHAQKGGGDLRMIQHSVVHGLLPSLLVSLVLLSSLSPSFVFRFFPFSPHFCILLF